MMSAGADLLSGAIDSDRTGEVSAAPGWRVLDRLEKTAIGARRGDGITTVRRREPAGCLLYGPYWQLPAGAYRLNFRCRSGKPRLPTEPVLGVEVIAMNRVQLVWLDLTAAQLQHEAGSVEFAVPAALGLGAGDEARLEFRFFHMGNADLEITAVDLRGVATAETGASPARLWHMLGRLDKTLIGRRTARGVVVSKSERPGVILDGGRPLLQLPRGHYRLSFRCAAAAPRMTAQPVLGVEIIARRRWQDSRSWRWAAFFGLPAPDGIRQAWRDFTAMELGSGSASIDFAVPLQLSFEGGREVLFGLRFWHFGNADLTISAIDLEAIEEQTAVAPKEWRLLGRLLKGTIGARKDDRVRVRQAEPAGRLLHGGRPSLRLPQGRYRLSFCCRAGQPRSAAQPALRVEVIGRPKSLGDRLRGRQPPLALSADFAAEALQGGSACVDFEVPPERGRDGAERATAIEFSFLHLGNADLVISEVNLRESTLGDRCSGSLARHSTRAPARTNVLFVGNCQAQTVYEALLRTSEFNARLDAKYHFVGLQQNLHELGRAELESSDVLVVQDIRDWENYPLRPFIPNDIQIIKFPLLHFASLWPFDHYNGPGDKEAYEREWPNLTFLYQDGLLARLRKEIPDREQRLRAYRELSVDGIINFVRLHDFEKRRLTTMDKQFGFAIGEFILANFQRRRLFYTTNHPNGQIIAMLLEYLLRDLGVGRSIRAIPSLDHLRRLQVPVHPKVAAALGVRWATATTKYLYGGEQITWETYVRRYIDHYG